MRNHLTALLGAACGLLVLAAAAAPALAAPAGYQIIEGPNLNAPPGALDSGSQVTCPTGKVPVGGGVATSAFSDMTFNTSVPGPTAWQARVNNPDSPSGFFQIDAICAKKPKGYTVAFSTVDNPPRTRSVVTATCPAGTVVLSGGEISSSDDVNVRVLDAFPPNKTSFRAVVVNSTLSDARATAEAVCAKQPAGYTIARTSFTENPNTLDLGGESCPAGKTVLGGGVQVSGADASVLVHSSINNLTTGWSVDLTTTTLAVKLGFSAICVA